MAKKGLGKGIDVLIPQAKEKTKSEKENIRTKEVIKEVVKESLRPHPSEAHRRRARKIYRGGLMPYGRKNTGRDAGGRAGHP